MAPTEEIRENVDCGPSSLPAHLRLNQAIREAMEDVSAGRIYEARAFMREVQVRWPKKSQACMPGTPEVPQP